MNTFDVAIVGGGPAGSTLGTLLKKYSPNLSVGIFEREVFPRDHVGESQLPPISNILDEMGVWDKIESADFPIKIGATYRWGCSDDLWDFEFLPAEDFRDEPRPAKFSGQRKQTAFQVDRAIYDAILLDHAAECGCVVRQNCRVIDIQKSSDFIDGLTLETGETLTANWYVDATGGSGLLRREMNVECEVPTSLKNVAMWDYWQNADWAVSIGVGGTRVQVMSLGYGWLWFIPLGPERTSVGLVCNAEYLKASGLRPKDLYDRAVTEEPRIARLLENATSERKFGTTKDWSFVAKRACGANWFLVGESIGFADPILAAGLTLTHVGARELAHVLVALDQGNLDAKWLKSEYETMQIRRVKQHIKFADFWYSTNAHFTDLKDFTSEIAKETGLELGPDRAFQWLAAGGFAVDNFASPIIGTFHLAGSKQVVQTLMQSEASWEATKYNEFRLNLVGAIPSESMYCSNGRVERIKNYTRKDKVLPLHGTFRVVVAALNQDHRLERILGHFDRAAVAAGKDSERAKWHLIETLEAMILDGWVTGKMDRRGPLFNLLFLPETKAIHRNKDGIADRRM